MSHPVRTIDELRAQLLEHGPWWLREPEEIVDALLTGIAAIFNALEVQTGKLHDSTFIMESLGDWLLEHGREHGDTRGESMTDDEYREHVRGIHPRITRSAILEAVQALLRTGTAEMEEFTLDGSFLIPEGDSEDEHAAWLDLGPILDSGTGFRLLIPEQAPIVINTGFVGVPGDGYEDTREFLCDDDGGGPYPRPGLFMEADEPLAADIYAQIARAVEQNRAAGVTARLEIV